MILVLFMNDFINVHLLNYRSGASILKHSLRLIYFSSILSNPLKFTRVHGFMICGQSLAFSSQIRAHHSPTVSHIDHVYVIINNHHYNSTGSSSVYRCGFLFGFRKSSLEIFIQQIQKVIVCFVGTFNYRI